MVRNNLPKINSLPILTTNVEFNYWYKNFGVSAGELDYGYTNFNKDKSVILRTSIRTYMFKFMYKIIKTEYFELIPYIGFLETRGEFSFQNTGDNNFDYISQTDVKRQPYLERNEGGFNGGLLLNYKIHQGEIFDILLGLDICYIYGTTGKDNDVLHNSKWILNTYHVKDNSSLSNINTSINIGFRYKL